MTTTDDGAVSGGAIRRARLDEATAVADVWLRSRRASEPRIPLPVHTDDDVREWFETVVLPERDVWVVAGEEGGAGEDVIAVMVLEPGWVDQLYVDPSATGRGLGSSLLAMAKQAQPRGLDLWTFQANTGARRFYARHGFVEIDATDGDNEEGAPDVRCRWDPAR